MRKDVECTFGILKGRWRILKTGIRLFGFRKADQIWLTCCALHNFLLEDDGLSKRWKKGVNLLRSDYTGNHGWHECEDAIKHIPLIFRRVAGGPQCDFDMSKAVPRDQDVCDDVVETVLLPTLQDRRENCTHIATLTRDVFRLILVEHWHYLFKRDDASIKWPSRNGIMET